MKFKFIGELLEDQLAEFKQNGEDKQPQEFTKNLNSRFKKISAIFKKFGKDVEINEEIMEPLGDAYKQIAQAMGPKMEHINTENLSEKFDAAADLFGQFIDEHGMEFEEEDIQEKVTQLKKDLQHQFKGIATDLDKVSWALEEQEVTELKENLNEMADVVEGIKMHSQYMTNLEQKDNKLAFILML